MNLENESTEKAISQPCGVQAYPSSSLPAQLSNKLEFQALFQKGVQAVRSLLSPEDPETGVAALSQLFWCSTRLLALRGKAIRNRSLSPAKKSCRLTVQTEACQFELSARSH